ncbi:lysine 5,6-aminomutase reactivase subunit KamB [Desmospora profundinema]|uniref:Uncharacterized protein n=1 Tax=Desmospora profundinema TaxID=1571184 RepID=A0ABU1IKY6_9BACL|nr:hypothetical protein [Desmospora profundinema]MDR6225439.1 hypothetical protein [Desmospora profundinema]
MKRIQSCAVFGLAKNVGKTTVLNAMAERADRDRVRVGLVSVGVDGEKWDVWSLREKPPIQVPADGWVATAASLLEIEKGDWEWVEETGIHSPLGPVMIARARTTTTVKLAGVHRSRGVSEVLKRMDRLGVELALVDGAYDRKVAGDPWLTDTAVAVAGAVMGPSLDEVVKGVSHWWSVAGLPAATDPVLRQAGMKARTTGRLVGVRGEAIVPLPYPSLLMQGEEWQRELEREEWTGLAVPGALTESGLAMLLRSKRPLELILSDPTRCFVSRSGLRRWFRIGGQLGYLRPLRLRAWAVNPVSPDGYGLNPRSLCERIGEVVHPVPVVDVKREGWPYSVLRKEGETGAVDG